MKIVPKLTIALVAGMCAILTVNGYFRVRREIAAFEADRVRDHEMIGRSLAAAVGATWRLEGEAPALASVDAVNQHFTRIRIRWLGVDRRDEWRIDVPPGAPAGKPVTKVARGGGGERVWYTYVPLEVEGVRRGVIELCEPTTNERAVTAQVVKDTATSALALALLSAALAFALGQWLVGAPIRALADQARRIGHGDFSGRLRLRHSGELDDLAGEMNAMCERLTSTLDQLRHADRLATVGQLASGVAHELGTPLNVVSARAGMIAAGDSTLEESRDYARVIAAAADRMTKIVRQLLQFARRKGTKKTPSDLRDLAGEAIDLLKPLAQKHEVSIAIAPCDSDTIAPVDPGQFQQVVTNLVMNAVQAMPHGGKIDLSFSTKHVTPPPDVGGKDCDFLCVRVHDTGEGIEPDALPHVFEPFFTTKDVGEGTGLGLPVSYGIVREHGGWIGVESEMHHGTTFTVFLPQRGA